MRYLLGVVLLCAAPGYILVPWAIDALGLIAPVEEGGGSTYMRIISGLTLVFLIVAALSIREAILMVRRGDIAGLRRATIFTKLAGIPFFVINFLFFAVVTHATLFFVVGFVIGPLAVGATYLLMLSTSVYGIGLLVVLKRAGAVSPAFFTRHRVLHLLFVVDIVSTLVVAAWAQRVLRHGPPPPEMLR